MKKFLIPTLILIELLLLLFFMVFWISMPLVSLIGIIVMIILFNSHIKKYTKSNIFISLFILFFFMIISPMLQFVYTVRTYCDFVKTEVLKADNGATFDFSKGKIDYLEGGGFQDGVCYATISFDQIMRQKIQQMGEYWEIQDDCIDYLVENHLMPYMEDLLRKNPKARMPSRCAIHADIKDSKDEIIIYDTDRNKLFYEYHNN